MRVGIGYDIHRLVAGRPLVLGGVRIDFSKGLLGHSDADVVCHAICDALLGAAAMGDIGLHFPDTDPAYKDADSLVLLKKVVRMVRDYGYEIENIDCTVFAEAPKLAPFRAEMAAVLAKAIAMAENRINIKATTTEGLGAIGSSEAIAAMCVALLV